VGRCCGKEEWSIVRLATDSWGVGYVGDAIAAGEAVGKEPWKLDDESQYKMDIQV